MGFSCATTKAGITSVLVLHIDGQFLKLDFPKKKEIRKSLPSNKRYMRIVRALKDFEHETRAQIKFLLGVAPVFSEYLTCFQNERPMVHLMFKKMLILIFFSFH